MCSWKSCIPAPTVLLALGHHLRSRSRVKRGAFWGGVIGHGIATVVALVALHYPPVLWRSDTRVFFAFWLLLVGGVVGALSVRRAVRAR